MRHLTPEEITTVLSESNIQLFRRGLLTFVRIEHPLTGGLEFDTAQFLSLAQQTAQATAITLLSDFLSTYLTENEVEPLP